VKRKGDKQSVRANELVGLAAAGGKLMIGRSLSYALAGSSNVREMRKRREKFGGEVFTFGCKRVGSRLFA